MKQKLKIEKGRAEWEKRKSFSVAIPAWGKDRQDLLEQGRAVLPRQMVEADKGQPAPDVDRLKNE